MEEFHENVIVGAGASGMMCGYLLGKSGRDAVILEKNTSPGKKLSATGNGRCNFTNRRMGGEYYYGDTEFVGAVLSQADTGKVIRMFEEIGMFHREKDGYCYPYNGQAATAVSLLNDACLEHGVSFRFDTRVTKVVHKDGEYRIHCKNGERYRCRNLILASGGKACASLGGDGSGYKLCRSLSHHVSELLPGLTGLRAEGREWNKLAGIRMPGEVSLLLDGRFTARERGEIQIVKDGISGIPVFQLCRVAAGGLAAGRTVNCVLDCCPELDEGQMEEWLSRHGTGKLSGLVHAKLAGLIRERAGDSVPEIVRMLKQYEIPVTGTFGIERAQVTAGGVATDEVSAETMQSKIHDGLYIIGELLDVDGMCGGYNLHFAWSTAYICARACLEE